VRAAVQLQRPDLVVLDLQIGNMGGMATCLNLRLEERAGRVDARKIIMLLDREADIFLAQRAESDGWLIKPLDAFRLRRAVQAVLDSGSYTEGLPAAVPAS
jgi:DNA-binding response OmpR family regulator